MAQVVWLVNNDREEVELHIDERFVASWSKANMPAGERRVLTSIVEHAYDAGKSARSREIRALIGG